MTTLGRRSLTLAALGGLISPTAWGDNTPSVGHAGGSSFVGPVMNRWTKASKDKGVPVDYAVLGTGEAQNQVMAGEIELATVELPMPKSKLEIGDIVQFPVVFGAMTCVVNIDGVGDGKLRLDAALLGGIYSKSIRSWRDPRIVAMNPDLRLPDIEVQPVFLGRPDGSAYSTSTTLAQYLLANNADWRERFPNGLRTRWATGSMVPDAASMIPVMTARQGGIGYMALGTALSNKLTQVTLRSKSGEWVQANADSLGAAVRQVSWDAPDLVVNTVDLPGAGVWPLVLPTYAMIARRSRNKLRGDTVLAFLRVALNDGDAIAIESKALPLPPLAKAKVLAVLDSL